LGSATGAPQALINEQVPSLLLGDVTRLRQILVKLISNAVKFTEASEVVVTVEVRNQMSPVETLAPGNLQSPISNLEFSVRDTGIGIPSDRLDRLFQAFSQVDASTTRQYGGTGLGLAISKQLCEMMGGRMWVESTPGQGTTFFFTIQVAAVASQPREYLRGRVPQLAGKRLLIVDDNATSRRILSRQAESWGMLPRATASGAEALGWLDQGDQFDIAVLDLQMPVMDGAQLAHEICYREASQSSKIKIRGAGIPLVLLTSLGRREEEIATGAFAAYLTKPLKTAQLFETFNDVVGSSVMQLASIPRSAIDPRLAERLPLRILLAEDNAVNQKVALRTLERLGYRADVAANGLEVLDALERQPYDVVLMDMQMPEMDGLEATRQIRQRRSARRQPRIIARRNMAVFL
jgi:CheY-like chemotaxis protein